MAGVYPVNPWPLVRFTEAPSRDSAVRFDFFDDSYDAEVATWASADGWSIGVPQIEGDPDSAAVEYGPRTVTFPLVIEGPLQAALRVQSRLAREVLRRRNWLMLQLTAFHQPVWFHTYGSQPGQLNFAEFDAECDADDRDLWQVEMTLVAEPFALGERERLSMVRVPNDPSKESGCRAVLPAIRGDAPAPVRVETRMFSSSAGGTSFGKRSMLAVAGCQRARTPRLLTSFVPISATVQTDSRYINGQALVLSQTAENAGPQRTLGYVETRVAIGSYRVLARVTNVSTPTGTSVLMGLRQQVASLAGDDPTTRLWRGSLSSTGKTVYVDLGVRRFPSRTMLPADVIGPASEPATTTAEFYVSAAMTGAGSIAVDGLLLLPVDTCPDGAWSALQIHGGPGGTQAWAIDGDDETLWQRDTLGTITGTDTSTHGLHPRVTPGVGNTLLWMPIVHDDPAGFEASQYSDTLTDYTEVTVSYHPRWLWVGDGGDPQVPTSVTA